MIGLIGRKIGMSQIFDEEGALVPVSVIAAGPCPVVQVKTEKKDGYNAVQIGFDMVRPTRAKLPALGHFRKANLPPYRFLQEFRVDNPEEFSPGQLIDVSIFKDIAALDVSGKSKGKGFQGVMKRHGFGGGRKTHGSHSHRIPGSIGMAAYPGKVLKGQKMPGRTGHNVVHVSNLKIVEVDTDNNLLLVKGAVPGARNTVLRLTTSRRKI
ncbi:MAG: 50S ribosomal protein L3 [Candidatus Krumholzibacteriota bacterium]|nr:50S ribosomal protein L3 [Candidatus Krumholzibacteriota bacterium]